MEEKETGVLQIAGFFVVMILEKSGFLYILYKFFIILCSGKQVQNRLNCIPSCIADNRNSCLSTLNP